MKLLKNLSVVLLGLFLLVCLIAYYWTRQSKRIASQNSPAFEQQLVDTSMLEYAVRLVPSAAVPEEQVQAREAWRLADHELDLTFAAAMRDAEAESVLPVAGPLRQLRDRVAQIKARVDADKRQVDLMGKEEGENLDRAQAQLELDQDELDDARQQLAREGGDKQVSLQRLLQEHEASDKIADQTIKFASPGSTRTLSEQIREWFALREYERQLRDAGENADLHARALKAQLSTRERQLPSQPEASASIARLRQLSGQRKALTGLNQRLQDTNQLVAVYQRWSALVANRRRAVLHLLLQSSAEIIAILLITVLLNSIFQQAFHQTDRRRLRQLRMIARIALQLAAILALLLIVFGPPTQLSTAIGLVTAGMAVVMKDFIVAFLGWFALMGKNGISVGDWVEIDGVSGEVVEIGLLKTVLLELGNWTQAGHPTGRRVAFSNSFAIEHHYFNFSTSGQWLWDEIQLTLPAEGDPYETAQKIGEIVELETKTNASEAAKEWQRVAERYGTRTLSANHAVELRPVINGLEVVVRYIARAPERNATKSKLFQAIVDLLRKVPPSER